jgi:hypothetical protein
MEDMMYRIKRELKEEFSGDNDFDIGYFEGKHSTKRWLIENEDLNYMYSTQSNKIHLWCDLDVVVEEPPRKKKKEEHSTRRKEKEEKADEALVAKHKNTSYTKNQLQLWARMIANDLHESYDDPPDNPLVTGQAKTPKSQKRDSISEVIAGAAAAIVKAVCPATPKTPAQHVDNSRIISPGRSANIRMNNLQQLQCLQRLFEDKVLTEVEFMEQKKIVLEALRSL